MGERTRLEGQKRGFKRGFCGDLFICGRSFLGLGFSNTFHRSCIKYALIYLFLDFDRREVS